MKNVIVWIFTSMGGIVGGTACGFFFGGTSGAMAAMLTGIIIAVPMFQMFGTAKSKGFLNFYVQLKDFEKRICFPDVFGKLHFLIVNTKHEGVCHKKDIGVIDDKGTEYSLGSEPISFGSPKSGYTIDVKNAHYTELLEKNRNIEDYEHAIQEALGETLYREFCKKYRKESEPDIYQINKEIDWLLDQKFIKPLEEQLFGETWGFKNFLRFLKYNYHPQALENAINTEKIWVKQEAQGYKDVERTKAMWKGVVALIFAIVIGVVVLSSVDLSGLLGGILP